MSGENPLHRARLARGIDLTEIARRTCLSPQVVQKIDEGRFGELPAGLYARSYVRAFASAIDLDGEQALAAIAGRLPPAEDPLPVLRDVTNRTTPAWMKPLGWLDQRIGPLLHSAVTRLTPGATSPAPEKSGEHLDQPITTGSTSWVRAVTAITVPLRRLRGPRPRPALAAMAARRVAALALDAAVLVLLHVLLVQMTAWSTGVERQAVLAAAGLGVTAVWALLVVQYFVLLGGIGGRTPGGWIARLRHIPRQPREEPLGVRAILYRTMLY